MRRWIPTRLARRYSRPQVAARIHDRDRDSPRIQRQIRAGQADRPLAARPHPLFRRLLSGQLRLHSADPGRRRRPARP